MGLMCKYYKIHLEHDLDIKCKMNMNCHRMISFIKMKTSEPILQNAKIIIIPHIKDATFLYCKDIKRGADDIARCNFKKVFRKAYYKTYLSNNSVMSNNIKNCITLVWIRNIKKFYLFFLFLQKSFLFHRYYFGVENLHAAVTTIGDIRFDIPI